MCGYCLDGPPCWVDVEMYMNAGQVDTESKAALDLSYNYWSNACEKSKSDLGGLYRLYGLNWRNK